MMRRLITLALLWALPAGAEGVGLVTITFDDASRAQYEHGLRLAVAHDLVGTLFVPTSLVEAALPGDWTLTWDEVRAFHAAGWEIGAHGASHARLPDLPADQLPAEIDGSAAAIADRIGEAPVAFSSPFGAFSDATLDRIMETYQAHLSWKGHGGRNPRAALDPRLIGRLEVVNTMTPVEVCGEMVASARDETWLVLLFHGVTEGEPADYEVSAAMLDEIFACTAFLRDRGLIDVVTVREGLARIGGTP